MTSTLDDISEVAALLRDVLDEIDRLTVVIFGTQPVVDRETGEIMRPAVIGLEGRYKRARQEAFTTSTVRYGRKWTVDQHNNAADVACFAEWADWNAAHAGLRAAKERGHTLRQELSAKQTAARVEVDLAR